MRSLFCAYGISGLLLLGSYASAQNIRLAEGSKNPYFFGGTPSEVRLNTMHQAAFDYLGQPPPGETPQVFARGIVSTDDQQHGSPSFSPDCNEVFWQTNRLDNEKKWHISVMTMLRAGDKWTEPEIAPYSVEPIFSPDGKRLYFESSQPAPDGKGDGPYFAEKQGNRWSERKNLGFVARFPELQFAYNLSITRNNTLYFLGHATGLGLRNDYGIYRAELINGVYAQPQLLPPSINLPPFMNWTPFIAPDESYLLFSSNRTGSYNEYGDLYVSFRLANGSWTDPINLGKPINSSTQERFPKVSPDGKYLFFTRWTPDHDEDVYWVSAGIIERLKAKANQETLLKADH